MFFKIGLAVILVFLTFSNIDPNTVIHGFPKEGELNTLPREPGETQKTFLFAGIIPAPRPINAPHILNDEDVECMALNVYHEARGEDVRGQLAVMDVVLNRVSSHKYPNTICKVVYQKKRNPRTKKFTPQFSWTLDGRSDAVKERDTYAGIVELVRHTLKQGGANVVRNAVLYHATRVKPYWSNSRKIRKVNQIGEHIFYAYNK